MFNLPLQGGVSPFFPGLTQSDYNRYETRFNIITYDLV